MHEHDSKSPPGETNGHIELGIESRSQCIRRDVESILAEGPIASREVPPHIEEETTIAYIGVSLNAQTTHIESSPDIVTDDVGTHSIGKTNLLRIIRQQRLFRLHILLCSKH